MEKQLPADRPVGGLVRAVLLAAVLGVPFLSGCSILSGGDDPEQSPDAAETSGEEAAPAFTPVSATAPADAEVGRVTIVYPEGNAELPDKVTVELDRLIGQLAENNEVRVELHAYAKGDEDEASRAKLFALKRGMLVRSHLHKNGIGAERMVLRPLGIESGDGPEDRVDIVLVRGLDPELETRIAAVDPIGQSGPAQAEAQPEPASDATADPAEGARDDEAAQRARLAQLQQAESAASVTPRSDLAAGTPAETASEVTTEAQIGDAAAVPGVIPQGDALPDPEAEGSLVARFEAIAAADVQLAEDPELRATIERKGGALSGPDGSEEDAVPVELAAAAPAQATDGEAAFVSRFVQPEGTVAEPAEPQFNPVPAAPGVAPDGTVASDPAVSVADGAAFEAAMAGEASQAVPGPVTEPAAPAPQLQSVVVPPQDEALNEPEAESLARPNVAALPPSDTMTTDPAAAGSRDLYLIQFEPDSPDMTVDGRTMLSDALEEILARPDTRVKIVAHAEGSQDDEFLLALSTIRRNEVEGALRNNGVHWGRIWSKAVGDKKPSAERADNNIVEIIIRQK